MAAARVSDRVAEDGARKPGDTVSGKPRQPFLDKFRTITGPELETLSAALLESYRGIADKDRQRQRREEDAAAIRAIIDTILANLTYQFLATGERQTPIVVQMRKFTPKQTRYDRRGFRKLQEIVKTLQVAGEIGFESGTMGKASTIWAGKALAARIEAVRPTYADMKIVSEFETIILSRNVWGFQDGERADGSYGPVRGKRSDRVDYTDTKGPSGTIAARRQLRALSTWLTAADIKFTLLGHRLDTSTITLTRRFTLTEGQSSRGFKFNQNGRLQDGWWMGVKSEDRRHILINGEHIADLDYSAMFIRLGCLKAGIALDPQVDPYELPGWIAMGSRRPCSPWCLRISPA